MIPQGLLKRGAGLARVFIFVFSLAQTVFGAIFAAVPIYLAIEHWFPAFFRMVNGQLNEKESSSVIVVFGLFGFFFFAFGTFAFFQGIRDMGRALSANNEDFLNSHKVETRNRRIKRREELLREGGGTWKPLKRTPTRSPAQSLFHAVDSRSINRVAFFGISIFAAIWNGILALGISDWRWSVSWASLIQAIFFTPFVLVGLVLIAVSIYFLLVSRLPSLRLKLEKPSLTLGETATLNWSFDENPSPLDRLSVAIEVEEVIKIGSGEDESRLPETIKTLQLASDISLRAQRSGKIEFHVPEDIEPSSSYEGREITWTLKAHAIAKRGPDLRMMLPIEVSRK